MLPFFFLLIKKLVDFNISLLYIIFAVLKTRAYSSVG